MAIISITIPAEQEDRVIDSLALLYRYDPLSGLTKAAYIKQVLVDRIKADVLLSERRALDATFDNEEPGVS